LAVNTERTSWLLLKQGQVKAAFSLEPSGQQSYRCGMSSVGTRLPRLDGPDKVTGRALYVDDITMEHMLHGRTVRSNVARGHINAIEFDPDFDWSSITVVTASDIANLGGENVVHLIEDDQPCLADDTINHRDEPIVLVAAETPELAALAMQHVRIDVTEEMPCYDMEKSTQLAGKPLLMERGDLKAAFARADHIIDGRYETGMQEQMYIEPQGMLAYPRDGGVVIKGSLQCPYYVHRAIKRLLSLDDEHVTVIQTVTGGGFGGKEEYPSMLAGHAALLALKSGRPVKMIYNRNEDLRATTKRHAAIVTQKMGVMNDGTLVAVDIDVLLDAGAYVTLTPVVLSRAILHASGPYRFEAVRIT
jgi:CO/xanthine dehydrogenase Mo-binding subunit